MSLLVVALLSLLWLGFFLPSLLEARRTSSPYASATTFQDSLRRLGEVPYPTPPSARTPAPSAVSPRAAAVKARRRDTLAVLGAAVVAGALLAIGFGGWALWAPLPPAVALAAYVVMLRREVLRRAARRTVARTQGPGDASADAALPDPQVVVAPVTEGPSGPDIVPSVRRRSALPPPERMAG